MNAPDEGTPAPTTPDYAKVIEELKAANTALVQKVSALEEKSKGYDAKITALSAPAPEQKKEETTVKMSDAEAAYRKALAELGIKLE
ncbi:MAG: hypothetical protein IIZ24_00660 [Candidatus Methanomethylophilus sp.]|nr:hypothetical protein [Methanomethylophilus sp.]